MHRSSIDWLFSPLLAGNSCTCPMFDSADSIEKAVEHEIRVKKAKKAAWSMLLLSLSLSQIGLVLTHVSYLLTRACHYKEEKITSSGKDVTVLTVFLPHHGEFNVRLHSITICLKSMTNGHVFVHTSEGKTENE